MFEEAVRQKIRFESPKGLLTTEDLWDLPLQSTSGKANLDDIARTIAKKLKATEDVSFVTTEPKVDKTLQLSFNVVKHVIDTLKAERDVAKTAKANYEKKQQLLELISQKENEHLKGQSLEDLRKMVEEMN